MRISLHGIAAGLVQILDETEIERSAAVLISLELGDCSVRRVSRVKSDNSGAAGTADRLILDFSLLNLANGSKQLNQVFVTR